MRSMLILIVVVATSTAIHAQDALTDLRYNEALKAREQALGETQTASRSIQRENFIYDIDTLTLPFFDDFTTDRIKRYHAKTTDPNISLKLNYAFEVNGLHPDTFKMMRDTTYTYTKVGTMLTKAPNALQLVIFYDSLAQPTGRDSGWANTEITIDLGTGIVTQEELQPNATFVNSADTFYLVADDASLWTTPADEAGRGGAFVNRTYAISPPTLGVATFDGTDALGTPYDWSSATTYGTADTLESKPLLLDADMTGVYLSFFYQAGGHGNAPETADSLVLEFFDPVNSKWSWAWGRKGELDNNDAWRHTWVEVTKPEHKLPGFKFRFRNHASLYGSLDHWHLDYVRLDKSRDTTDGDTITDVAMVQGMSSFTHPYSSVPYKHYLAHSNQLQATKTNVALRNLGPQGVFVNYIEYKIEAPDGSTVSTTKLPQIPSLAPRVTNIIETTQPTAQIFPNTGKEVAKFKIRSYFNKSGDNDQLSNDTALTEQVFWNHYAYDDGTAEKAYTLTGSGTYLACRFATPKADTLKALHINFPRVVGEDIEELLFEIMVWADTANDPVYVSPVPENPQYTFGNRFARFPLAETVVVDGTFFIGFRQLQADKIYMGFDVNNKAENALFYKVGPYWSPASFEGSLLMRPDFGNTLDPSGVNNAPHITPAAISIWPTPAHSEVWVSGFERHCQIEVFNLNGQMLFAETLEENQPLNLSSLPTGFYVLRATQTETQQSTTAKLIIAR